MTFRSAYELLEHLLRNEPLSEADLVAFLRMRTTDEGLHLDFKHADELNKPAKDRAFTIRQYATAFANSDGGVLMIGVEDRTKALAPITAAHESNVGKEIRSWAKDCIADLTSYFGVQPRFSTIDVTGGKVLLIAIARAPMLIPIRSRDGREVYYFRIEDDARAADPYLVSDLQLGRREHPILTVTPSDKCEAGFSTNSLHHELALFFSFEVTNESMLTARDVRVGVIGRFYRGEPNDPPTVPKSLLRHLDVEHIDVHSGYPLRDVVTHWGDEKDTTLKREHTLRFSDTATAILKTRWVVPFPKGRFAMALYVQADGSPPDWWQLTHATRQGWQFPERERVTPRLERVVGVRPRVALDEPDDG